MTDSVRGVKAEKIEEKELVVVYGDGILADRLVSDLSAAGLKVSRIKHAGEVLPVLVKPNYIFYFLPSQKKQKGGELTHESLLEAGQSARRNKAKFLFIVFDDNSAFSREAEEVIGKNTSYLKAEIKGEIRSQNVVERVSEKIMIQMFSQNGSKSSVILGESFAKKPAEMVSNSLDENKESKDLSEVLRRLSKQAARQKRKRTIERLGISVGTMLIILFLTIVVILLTAPFFWVGIQMSYGIDDLTGAKVDLERGDWDSAKFKIGQAQDRFYRLKRATYGVASQFGDISFFKFTRDYYFLTESLYESSMLAGEVVSIGKTLSGLPRMILVGEPKGGMDEVLIRVQDGLPLIDQRLGILEARLKVGLPGSLVWVLQTFGLKESVVGKYQQIVGSVRSQMISAKKAVLVLPQIVASKGNDRTYLVVFQNSAELRPTGGFVGSFALVRFSRGKMAGYKVYDVYDADGQLRGRVNPPDEILHYLGQPNWFLRDVNWAVDWPLTAKRMEWFLEKELGQKVDGVVGIDIGAIQKVLVATGPIKLVDFNDIVGAEDFYHKAQYQAEIDFFPGSTKKRDYLGAVAQGIIDKLTNDSGGSLLTLSKAINDSIAEKNIQWYFNDEEVSRALNEGGENGKLQRGYCSKIRANCLMVVEANLGANKANYFVKRDYKIKQVVDKAGGVNVEVNMIISNDSPSISWPGGDYKNYQRFLVPGGSKVLGINLGDGRIATESSILTANVISEVPANKFLVFRSNEQVLVNGEIGKGNFDSYGLLISVPVGEKRQIVFSYKPNYRMNFAGDQSELRFGFLKQSGIADPYVDFEVDYPNFLAPKLLTEQEEGVVLPIANNSKVGVSSQKLVFKTNLKTDRFLSILFQRSK